MNFFGSSEPKKYDVPSQLRLACRSGAFNSHTTGQCHGHAQANLMILPKKYAYDFLLYCTRNPKPCPLLHVLDEGEYTFGAWGKKVDVRTDVPRYRVFRDGEPAEEVSALVDPSKPALPAKAKRSEDESEKDEKKDKSDKVAVAGADLGGQLWRSDFVTFVMGCSFSFEEALLRGGVPVRNIEQNCNVPMYRSNIQTEKAGIFEGPMVVSMRPMTPEQAIRAVEITSRYPKVHGAPIYIGAPELHGMITSTASVPALGIADLGSPDYGDAVDIREGEVCVFWACGVTPQQAVLQAKPSIAITHAPGKMLVLDVKNDMLQ